MILRFQPSPHAPEVLQLFQANKPTPMAKAIGAARSTDTNYRAHALTASSGRGQTFTPARGLGASMVADLEGVKRKAKAQYRSDRRAAALDRLAERLAHSPLACRY